MGFAMCFLSPLAKYIHILMLRECRGGVWWEGRFLVVPVIALEEMKGFIIVLMTKCDPQLLCRHMPRSSYEVSGFSTVSTNWL